MYRAKAPGLFEHLAAGKARTPHHLCGWRKRAEAAEITQNFGGKNGAIMGPQFDLVGKIGSMALIRKEDKDIDYNIFSRLGAELTTPGVIPGHVRRDGNRAAGLPEAYRV